MKTARVNIHAVRSIIFRTDASYHLSEGQNVYSFLSRHSLRQFRNCYCRMVFNNRNDVLLTFRKFNQFFFPDIFKVFPDIYPDIIIHRSFILFTSPQTT